MGATESIFYDDEPAASEQYSRPPFPQDVQPHQTPNNGPARQMVNGHRVVRRAKVRSAAGEGKIGAGSHSPAKVLHGAVFGLPGSGKSRSITSGFPVNHDEL